MPVNRRFAIEFNPVSISVPASAVEDMKVQYPAGGAVSSVHDTDTCCAGGVVRLVERSIPAGIKNAEAARGETGDWRQARSETVAVPGEVQGH